MGAVSGGISAGVNVALGAAGMVANNLGTMMLSGAIGGGLTSEAFGGNFWEGAGQGALAGAVSWGVNQCIGDSLVKWAGNDELKTVLANGFTGATVAGLTGGDMKEGFAYGAVFSIGSSIVNRYKPTINPNIQSESTPSEMADINKHIYYGEEGDSVSGWTLEHVEKQGSLRMGVYSRVGADGKIEYVIANAGTKPLSIGDWINNILAPFGLSPDTRRSMEYSKNFVKRHPGDKITFTGHSKGGAEAAANAMATNRNAVLFNPAPFIPRAYGLSRSNYSGTMTSYIVKGEILNNLLFLFPQPTSNIIYLPCQSWNPVTDHLMGAVKTAID
jgi:hypothetical protein